MFNNIVLDIFIGLVLIYLLYSLFITIISEMVVTWMGLRSRMLRVAIEKMLNDGYHRKHSPDADFYKKIWDFIQGYFLKEFKDFKHSFAGKFYANPSVKYLSNKGGERTTFFSQTKPSYISADMFAETLIQILKDKGNGATDIEKVNFCLRFNTHHIEPATLKSLMDHAANAGNDVDILKERFKAWYNETMDRTTGWYKRKLQLILFWLGFIVAVIFNVDTIQIVKILSKDKEARDQLVTMGVELSKDSARYKDFLAQGDTLHSKTILDSGYAHISKDISDANMILGLGWPLSSLMKSENKSFNRKENKGSYELLKEYQNVFNEFSDTVNKIKNKLGDYKKQNNLLTQQLIFHKKDTAVFNLEQSVSNPLVKQTLTDTLKKTEKLIDTLVNNLAVIKTSAKADSSQLMLLIQSRQDAVKQVSDYTSLKFILIDSITIDTTNKKEDIIVHGRRPYTTLEKIGYFLSNYNPFSSGFWSFIFSLQFVGILITALMLSLGAPFWFDLLKKLIAIRGSGVKPEEKKQEEDSPNEQPVKQAFDEGAGKALEAVDLPGDVYEEGLKVYGPEIRKIPGVKSVFTVVKNKIKQLQVNVDTDITKQEVLNHFPTLLIGTVEVHYDVVVSGIPISHQGLKGMISNKSGKNGFGSLGCILRRKETGSKHLLSCWHVLKGDFNYSDSDNEPIILDHESEEELADRWAGGIRDQFDYGLAICRPNIAYNDNSFLKAKLAIPAETKLDFRFVTKKDVDNQIQVKYYDNLNDNVVNGLIYTNSPEVDINYIDKTRTIKDILILTDENEKTISKEGNSGSIVFDSNNKAIAMIIGGDLNYSYAVRLSHIFSIHEEMNII